MLLLSQKKTVDFVILSLTLLFALFGILMIYEASNVVAFSEFGDKYHFVKDQFLWFLLGIGGLSITSFLPYKKYRVFAFPLLVFSLLSLIAVFLPGIGIRVSGANRWVGIGAFSFQPSEIAKMSLIIYLSSWLGNKEKNRFFAFFLLFLLIVGLVVLQPDLGTAVILTLIFIVMYFLSGAPFWHFLILLPVTLAGVLGLAVISPYRFQRLVSFLNPNIDPLGISYHIRQILISFGSGGFWGLGLGASRQKYQFLPAVSTDSIFAIIGEEFGFIGAFCFILLFCFYLYRIYLVAKNAPDTYGFLLTSGCLALLSFQMLINLGAMVALFPLTGVPLPFISYGGSNLITSFIAAGIILNVSKEKVYRN